MSTKSPPEFDVSETLDEGGFSALQMLFVLGAALTIILDGIDNIILSPALTTLMKDWSLSRKDFEVALAASPVGMMIGGALGGWLGDRIGRRTALLGSVLSFAAITAALSLANGVVMLTVLRLLAGLGLGGAMPNATALASEYVPRRHRPFAVSLTIVCIPVGATLAALMGEYIIKDYGWRTYFTLGGVGPFLIGFVLLAVLPESPHFLAKRRQRWPELVRLLRKLGHEIPDDAVFVEKGAMGDVGKAGSMSDLFNDIYRRDTLALIVAFFFCLMISYVGLLLLPAALESIDFTQPEASRVLRWWTIGGVGGALVGALVIQKLGSRAGMLGFSAICIVSSIAVALMPLEPDSLLTLAVLSIVMGGSLNAVQVAMYALAAHVYPTEIRGRGVGTVVAFARVGNIVAPFVGIRVLAWNGVPAYFGIFAVGMFVVLLALAAVRRHIEPSRITIRTANVDAEADD